MPKWSTKRKLPGSIHCLSSCRTTIRTEEAAVAIADNYINLNSQDPSGTTSAPVTSLRIGTTAWTIVLLSSFLQWRSVNDNWIEQNPEGSCTFCLLAFDVRWLGLSPQKKKTTIEKGLFQLAMQMRMTFSDWLFSFFLSTHHVNISLHVFENLLFRLFNKVLWLFGSSVQFSFDFFYSIFQIVSNLCRQYEAQLRLSFYPLMWDIIAKKHYGADMHFFQYILISYIASTRC